MIELTTGNGGQLSWKPFSPKWREEMNNMHQIQLMRFYIGENNVLHSQ